MNEPVLMADLHAEDDDGNNWTLVHRDRFDPAWVYPGAIVQVGHTGGATEAEVLRTELHQGPTGRQHVLVTFRQMSNPT